MAQQNAWTVNCIEKGTHSDDDREQMMIAINYTLTHNNGQTTCRTIMDRLKAKGYSKIVISTGNYNMEWTASSYKLSVWKINGKKFWIRTDVVLE